MVRKKITKTKIEDIEADEVKRQNETMVFDEAQFDMGDKEYFDIEYLSGDLYRGELLGENRHGFGMIHYKASTGEKVLGIWRNNYLLKGELRHPLESAGELIPLSVTKYEGRTKKSD